MTGAIHTEHETDSKSLSEETRTLSIGHDRPIRISAGHRLLPHEGKCSQPHGHNYEIAVEVTGTLGPDGWVVDKGAVTAVINEWDHHFLLQRGDPLITAFEQSGDGDAVILLDHPPTAEVMGFVLEDQLHERLPASVSEIAVEVRETSELCARPSE